MLKEARNNAHAYLYLQKAKPLSLLLKAEPHLTSGGKTGNHMKSRKKVPKSFLSRKKPADTGGYFGKKVLEPFLNHTNFPTHHFINYNFAVFRACRYQLLNSI